MNSELAETVSGQRLQVTCRALGITFKEDGEWVKTSRNYPAKWCVSGVIVSAADAVKLRAHIDTKKAKLDAKTAKAIAVYNRRTAAEAKAQTEVEAKLGKCPAFSSTERNPVRTAWREAFYVATEKILLQDAEYAAEKAKDQKRREANVRREKRELDAIISSVNSRWNLDESDVTEFAKHANEPGEGRVVRTKTACTEDFDTKVYMALVAWVRHNKTDYDDKRSAAKDAAYAGYLEAKEAGDSYEERGELLDQARADSSQARNELHTLYTAEAVAWLKSIEKQAPQVAKLAALPMNSLGESAPAHIDAAQPTAEVECSVASGQSKTTTFLDDCQGMCVRCAMSLNDCTCKVSSNYFRAV